MSAAPARVLVIDDEPPIRKLLRMGLARMAIKSLRQPTAKTLSNCLENLPT